jgi:putative hydrolase of the HAD superfamily
MSIRAVIFDYGGVVCFHPSREQMESAAARCGLDLNDFVHAMWAERLRYDAGQDAQEYWRGVARYAGLSFDDALIQEMIGREIDFWSRWDDRVLGWTKQLRSAGIRTAILSNLPQPLSVWLRSHGAFLDHFDHVTLSSELKLVKPQPGIYEDVVKGLGVAPEDALFLDDRPENVAGGQAVGLRAELYTCWEQFSADTPLRYALPAPLVARPQ